jgi:hypothetical protein
VTENPQLVFGKLHMKTKIFFGIKGENTFQLICNGFRSVSDEQKETSILELMKKNAPIDLGNDSSES